MKIIKIIWGFIFFIFCLQYVIASKVSFYDTNIIAGWHLSDYSDVKGAHNFTVKNGNVIATTDFRGVTNSAYNFSENATHCGALSTGSTLGDLDTTKNWSISFWYKKWGATGNDGFIERGSMLGSTGDWYITLAAAGILAAEFPSGNTKIVVNDNAYYHYVLAIDSTAKQAKVYLNGTLINTTSYTTISSSSNIFTIGAFYRYTPVGVCSKTIIDEVILVNKSLTLSEVQELYNNYDTWDASAIVTPSYSLNTTQKPTDLNSSFTGILNISLIVKPNSSDANPYNKTTSYAEIFFNINSSLYQCSIFYQKVCYQNKNTYYIYNMTKLNASVYEKTFTDNDYYPAYYPYNYSYINSNLGNNKTVWNNYGIKFNVFNFSTSSQLQFLDIELDVQNLSSEPMKIYYCNSSYISGDPQGSINCQIIDVFNTANHTRHLHNTSSHYAIPIVVSITRSPVSYFIFKSESTPAAKGYNFRYVTNSNYDNQSFNTFGTTFTMSNTSDIYDIHIHNYLETDFFKYYTKYYDGLGNSNISATIFDFYNIINTAPSVSDIISPCNQSITLNSTGTNVLFTWDNATDLNNDSIYYSISLGGTSNINIGNNIENWYYLTTLDNSLTAGTYYPIMQTCDNFGNCDTGATLCNITLCKNSWNALISPCTGGTRQIQYTDLSGCSQQYDLPVDANTYIYCNSSDTILITTSLKEVSTNVKYLSVILLMFMGIYFIYTRRQQNNN